MSRLPSKFAAPDVIDAQSGSPRKKGSHARGTTGAPHLTLAAAHRHRSDRCQRKCAARAISPSLAPFCAHAHRSASYHPLPPDDTAGVHLSRVHHSPGVEIPLTIPLCLPRVSLNSSGPSLSVDSDCPALASNFAASLNLAASAYVCSLFHRHSPSLPKDFASRH